MSRALAIGDVELVVLLLVVSMAVALLARRVRVPYTLALVLVGLALGFFGALPHVQMRPDLVLFLFLPALLFEGSWTLHTSALLADWLAVLLLAVPGLIISLLVITLVMHWGVGLSLLDAALFGAIVSPTDPVAVVGLLRQLRMPVRLRTIIESESLFNDGVGAAAYELVLGLLLISLGLHGDLAGLSTPQVVLKAVWLIAGGPLLGLALGYIVSRALRHVDDHVIETTATFSVAYGSYILGTELGTSGLLTVVCAALVYGSYGRRTSMRRRTRFAVDDIWEFTGFLANSLLFLLLGIQIGAASFVSAMPAIIWGVVAVIAGRALMIYTLLPAQDALTRWLAVRRTANAQPEQLEQLEQPEQPEQGAQRHPAPIPALWRPLILLSGLRGALSLALALSLPTDMPNRELLQLTVYGLVLVTLLGQGLSLRLLLPRWPLAKTASDAASEA